MSLVIYHNRALYADRAGHSKELRPEFFEMRKFFVDPEGRFALAFTGSELDLAGFEATSTYESLVESLKQIEGIPAGQFLLPVGLSQFDGTLFLMTASQLFVARCEESTAPVFFKPLNPNQAFFSGSGESIARGILDAVPDKSIHEVIRLTGRISSTMFPTQIDWIGMDDLLSFVEVEKNVGHQTGSGN